MTLIVKPDHRAPTMRRAGALSAIFRSPMTGYQDPTISTALQAMYLPKPAPSPSGGRGSQPTGRPPAVQSQVAGSSVANLIS